jgi:hypothetical protein
MTSQLSPELSKAGGSTLSADARGFIPPHVKSLFDNPLPTIILPPGTVLDDVHAAGLRTDGLRIASTSACGLLSQQLPVGAAAWPSINDGLCNSRHLLDTVVQATMHPVTALTPGRYAEHSIALLAAEVASSRAEVSSYDLHVSDRGVGQERAGDLCVTTLRSVSTGSRNCSCPSHSGALRRLALRARCC